MMRKIKNTIICAGLSVLLIGASATSAFAEGSDTVTNDNGLSSLAQLNASGQLTIAQPSKVINDTYWSDLEKISITNSQNKTYYGVLPKYVLKPGQTALKHLGIYAGGNGSVDAFPSTGISETEYGIRILDYLAFYRFGYLVGEDTYAPPFKDRPSTDPIPDRVNPYKFTSTELLTQEEIKDPMKLTVYADIKKKDSKDSKLVDEYKPGEALPLDFTVNASWFKRYIMGFTLDRTRTGYMSDEEIKQEHDSYGTFDSQIVYTLDIPEGVDVNNPSATLSGLDGFDVTTEVKNENGKKILIVSLRLKEDKRGKTAKWKDTIEKLRKLDTSNIKISVSGLSVSSTAAENKNITLRGTASGFFEWATARSQDLSSNNTNAAHVHLYFAAKQSEAGRDSAADKTKPNLISYTFKVKAPEQNTVTFINDDSEYAKVKVENGKSISGDALDTESMPKNPAKEGYVFKEWNTQKDGKGTKFDGKTIVNNDITVYAIFVKNPNKPGTNPNKPVPDRIDGNDRIDTATNISKKYYDRAKTVIVVRHDLFPDSMTASVLAKLKDAPILLNPTNKLDPRVGAEIKRLGASEVIIVGGQNSISEKVREELRIYDADKDVERIAGHDRYGTSEMVARRVVGITGKKNKAVVASGEVFPDALAVGTYASREGYPILLVRKDLVPTQITKAIKDLEIKNTYIAGGYNTISKSTELKLPGVLERMAGKTRYETAIAIARSKFADSKEAYIVSGEEFADALAISPMSGKYNRPTLLVKSKAGQNKPVSDYVYFKNINRITAIGGYRYIPNDVLKELVN